jgi:hypothetical protein
MPFMYSIKKVMETFRPHHLIHLFTSSATR